MFERLFGKRRHQEQVNRQVRDTYDTCVALFRETWRKHGVGERPASTPDELAERIDEFAAAAFRIMFEQFPITRHAKPFDLWLVVFTAVLEAKTHPTAVVNEAIDTLRSRYAN